MAILWNVCRIAILCLAALSVACVPQAKKTSKLIFQVPKNKLGALSAAAAPPVDQKACYGANISGPGIDGFNGAACAPQTGIVAGYVEDGGTIEVEVPRGEGRKIQVYLYLLPVGDSSACPTMIAEFAKSSLTKTYMVGEVTGLTFDDPTEYVTVPASFPGLSQNIAVQNSYPAACLSTSTPHQSASAAAGEVSGTGYKLWGKVGRPVSGAMLTGSGYQLKVIGR